MTSLCLASEMDWEEVTDAPGSQQCGPDSWCPLASVGWKETDASRPTSPHSRPRPGAWETLREEQGPGLVQCDGDQGQQ